MRLDKLVAERFGLSRRAAQEAIRNGQVDLDGSPCLEGGRDVENPDALAFEPGRPRPGSRARHLKVLYEDREILVVDKPAGLLTQPTTARERGTLLERASSYLARKHGRERPYVGIVHRLDRDTSGTLLLVTSPRALRPFQALFQSHAIERTYLAVVEKIFVTPTGRIDLPLIRDRGDGRRGVARSRDEGVAAVTHYTVRESFGVAASVLSCRLETGRTHQIRIHLAELGHPVVGDAVYRPRGLPRPEISFPRQALHAQEIGFTHPLSGVPVRVQADLPHDLHALIADLRTRFGSITPEA